MLIDGGGNFRARERVELVEKENGGTRVLVLGARRAGDAAAAFGTQLMADFSAGDQDALRVLHFAVGNQRQEARFREFLDLRAGVGWRSILLG